MQKYIELKSPPKRRWFRTNERDNDFAEKVAFKLQNKVLKKGHDIKVNLYNTPDTPPSNTPLETTVRIGNLENGIYNLSVKLKDRSVPGKLTVSDKAYNFKTGERHINNSNGKYIK